MEIKLDDPFGGSDTYITITRKELLRYLECIPKDAELFVEATGYYGNDLKEYFQRSPDKNGKYLLFKFESLP